MEEQNNSSRVSSGYRKSFFATILFSGVQIFQIIIRIIKSKFVALIIGPAGMGISSLLYSTAELISASTNLGLKTSGVKAVAAANREENKEIIAKTVFVLRRLILLTGLLGTIVCAILAPLWSKASFGNANYVWSFVIVSLVILFEQLNSGELVLLQGTQQKRYLAKANIIGQTISLLFTIPLYYFLGVKAIALVLVLSALVTFVISRCFSNKLHMEVIRVTWKETFTIGREMIKLGFFLSLQFLIGQLVVYVVRNYVSNTGGIEDVGLYSAGTTIVTTYIGLVFAAIATDYFPRLASTKTNEELQETVYTQADITLLLLAPIIVAFIIFIKPIVILLYSDKFLPIEEMMYWSVGATLLKAMGWAASNALLAKAKPSVFFLNEFISACYTMPLNLVGYSKWGLVGFGISTLLSYVIYLVQVLLFTKKLFGISYPTVLWKSFLGLNIVVLAAVLVKYFCSEIAGYIIGCVLLLTITIYVFKQLEVKMGLISSVIDRIKRNKL